MKTWPIVSTTSSSIAEKVPVARPDVAAEQIRERRELHGLPDRDAGDDGHDPDDRHREIRQSLQRVVLALPRMILSNREIELHHLPRVAHDAAARHEVAPLAVQIDEARGTRVR